MAASLAGKRVLFVFAPEQFRDEELLEPKRILEAAGARTALASTRTGVATGMLGARVMPQMLVRDAKAQDYDAVVVVGGMGSPRHLWNDGPLLAILRDRARAGKVVGAICLSGAVLGKSGIAKGRRATCWPDDTAIAALRNGGATYEKADVVVDGNLVSADGPASATKFGEAIVRAMTAAAAPPA
jgi:protease I